MIQAEAAGKDSREITFRPAESYSPYMELSNPALNFTLIDPEVEINPYYRFYALFKDFFDINNPEDLEFRQVFFDIAIHFLAEIDRRHGLNKREYYLKFILNDLTNELLGPLIRRKLPLFTKKELQIIANNLLNLYTTGEMLYLLKDTIRQIFLNSLIYANYESKNELLFFINYEKTAANEAKLDGILSLFLPIEFRTEIYWQKHFGIIGHEETMLIDQIALY